MVFQWWSSVNLHNSNTLDQNWKTTGSTLATTILCPVAFQCTLGSKFQAHWIATRLPLNYHWLWVRVVSMKSKLPSIKTQKLFHMPGTRWPTQICMHKYGSLASESWCEAKPSENFRKTRHFHSIFDWTLGSTGLISFQIRLIISQNSDENTSQSPSKQSATSDINKEKYFALVLTMDGVEILAGKIEPYAKQKRSRVAQIVDSVRELVSRKF